MDERDELPVVNCLRARRRAANLAQVELARRAGVTRQTISALEAGTSAPSLAVALRLAGALGCQVDDLFWLEQSMAQVEAELLAAPESTAALPLRVQVARVGARVLARPLDASSAADGLVVPGAGGPGARGRATVRLLTDPELLERTAVILGCDPALGVLATQLQRRHQRAGLRLSVSHAGSVAALAALARGEAHVAGMHLLDEASGEYNLPFVRRVFAGREVLVVTAAHWAQGLIVAPGNPLGISGVADLARPEVRIVNREPGSGSRGMLDHELLRSGIAPALVRGYDRNTSSHRGVAEIVASGLADAGPGIQAAASALGLGFVWLADERYDLVIPAEYRELPPVQALLATLISPTWRAEIAALPGYDLSATGTVQVDGLLAASA